MFVRVLFCSCCCSFDYIRNCLCLHAYFMCAKEVLCNVRAIEPKTKNGMKRISYIYHFGVVFFQLWTDKDLPLFSFDLSLSFSEPQCWLLHLSGPLFCSSRNTNLNTICYRNYYSMWMQYSRNKRTQWEKNAGPNERVPMVKMYNVPMEQIKVVSNELLLICSTRNKMDKTKVVTNVELAWKRRLDLLGRYSTCNNGSSYLVFVCYWYIISSFQSLVHAISDTRTAYFSLLRIFRWDSRFKRRITNMDENESEIITL